MKDIILLGATGSIGTQTLEVIQNNSDKYRLLAFSAGQNVEKAADIVAKFNPKYVCMKSEKHALEIKDKFACIEVFHGQSGLVDLVSVPTDNEVIVLTAVSGAVGLLPTLKAIENKRDIALANKETLVTAGHIVMEAAKKNGVNILPVDSEHSAIFQCLQGESAKDIKKIIITASGGTFRDSKREDLINVTAADALKHPNWSMGAKITIDSATMMNKGLEVIEAHWIFNLSYDKIDTVLHKQSIIHSLVEFNDGSLKAQLGVPSMKVPIAYALSYPRHNLKIDDKKFNILNYPELTFEKLSHDRFPCLKMAYEAGVAGGSMPTVLNAANEVAVNLFLNGKISFLDIEKVIATSMEKHNLIINPT